MFCKGNLIVSPKHPDLTNFKTIILMDSGRVHMYLGSRVLNTWFWILAPDG